MEAMERANCPSSRRHKFAGCGDEVHCYWHALKQEAEFRGSSCNDRFCEVCGIRRSLQISRALRELIADAQPLFITLTIRGKPTDHLAGMLVKLRAAWRELRRIPLWKNSIRGGAIMLEIKWSKSSGGHWHPHYHILADGSWIDVKRLRAAWYAITGDSDQVDVQRVRDLEEAMHYVTKYASKPTDASFTMHVGRCAEAIHALKGARLCACFGSWFGTPLREELEERDGTESLAGWIYCGTIDSLAYRSAEGDAEAKIILDQVERLRRIRSLAYDRRRGPPAMRGPTSTTGGGPSALTGGPAAPLPPAQ